MGSGRYLVIDDYDVLAELEERDVIQAKKEWKDEPNIVIARVIWESNPKAIIEGELIMQCNSNLLDKQE